MKKTTLIYLGVGAVAYYLFYQWNKNFTKAWGGGGGNNQAPPKQDVINEPTETCKDGFELKETPTKCIQAPCPTIKSCVVKGSISNQPVGFNKEALFNSTIRFRGGVYRAPEVEAELKKSFDVQLKQAQAKIDQLGLRAEYDAWYKKRQELMRDAPLPPQVMCKKAPCY
jgi:hypothetical protein